MMAGMKQGARLMIPRKKGSIINTASITSVIGGLYSYCNTTSNHAVIVLTRNGAVDLGKYGIRVNAVSLYGLPSDLTVEYFKKKGDGSSFSKEADKQALANFCSSVANLEGTILTAEDDVSEACLYLASDESKYVSITLLWMEELVFLIIAGGPTDDN